MIPFDFECYMPENAVEAAALYRELQEAGKEPFYYAGGTEIVTFCRQQIIKPGALVDLKSIPEVFVFEPDGDKFNLGACVTLSKLSDSDDYPLLGSVARRVADRTVRNRLTLGGNICGSLPYRETILPLLAVGAEAHLVGPEGRRSEPLTALFDKRLKLNKGELLVSLTVNRDELKNKSWSRRREYHGPVDYPLCHLVAVRKRKKLALAVSGLCAYPFRSEELEGLVNDINLTPWEQAEKSLERLPGVVRSDEMASDQYRRAMWKKDLAQMLEEMGGMQ